MLIRRLSYPMLAVVLLLLPSCVKPRATKPTLPVDQKVVQSSFRFRKEYVLAPGDQIEVLVRRTPEVSRTLTIRPDGYISLPMLDDVSAAGLTSQELDDKITKLLSTRLVDPEVTVIATQVRQPMVYVTGDVNTPAPVPLRNAATAMQAIAVSGGLRRSAAVRDIAIIRLTGDGHLTAIPIKVESGGQPGPYMGLAQIPLQADDVIFVPESGRSQLARFLDDFVNRPVVAVTAVMGIYTNFKLIQILHE